MIYYNERLRNRKNRVRKTTLLRFTSGIRQLATIQRWKNCFVAVYVFLAILAWNNREKLLFGLDVGFPLFSVLVMAVDCLAVLLILLGLFGLISAIGTPIRAQAVQDRLLRAGFFNHFREPPILLAKYKSKNNSNIIIWEFDKNEIPTSTWQDSKQELEAALHDTIIKIEQSKNGRRMILHTVSARSALPAMLHWKDSYLNKDDFVLTLGESLNGRETTNLAKMPHLLLGGSTGSGKSVLLKLLIMQCVKKGAEVYIADFKGGVDFSPAWHKYSTIITEKNELLDCLTEIVDELERRKELLRNSGCANISEYNQQNDNKLKRIVFACDEVAEVLDKTGLSKEAKELVTKIESKLSVIARQGRAFGINLILATQRPDSQILSGQIRNNIDFRVCGRADNVLSQIILDNTSAAEQIPKDAQGRFITNTGTVFQSYLFDDGNVFSDGSVQVGGVPNGETNKRFATSRD